MAVMKVTEMVGVLTPYNIVALSPTGKDYFCLLLLILNQLPIADDLHWYILGMLKYQDVFP